MDPRLRTYVCCTSLTRIYVEEDLLRTGFSKTDFHPLQVFKFYTNGYGLKHF